MTDHDLMRAAQQAGLEWARFEYEGTNQLRDFANIIAAGAAPVPTWISVADKLPTESDGTVAVLMDDGSILTAWATYWHGASNKFAQWTHPFDVDDAQVTHWMPLPATPKEPT